MISEETVANAATLMPRPERSVVAVSPPGPGPGTWAGAPSAARGDGEIYLAYRLRRPEGQGRGYAVVVARSADGVRFETLLTIGREEVGAESLERPALVPTPDGAWRLYLSCATPGTKHWRVEVLEAGHPAAFDARRSRVVLPGDAGTAVKDPVLVHDGDKWHLWASVHPLADPEQTDQMATEYACSADGLTWTWLGTALGPRPGEWDSRGVRVTAVRLSPGEVVAYYDGRASAAENFEERTGLATGAGPSALAAHGPIAQSPYGAGGLRYLTILPRDPRGAGGDLGDSRERYYYEMTRTDGAHELRTELR
ncbi:MAG TPA: hypothetical protein VH307_18165 [Streptosporangiaceae bacterium]|nr:hypothetical protein [Streptosporangiaceae bacterium]